MIFWIRGSACPQGSSVVVGGRSAGGFSGLRGNLGCFVRTLCLPRNNGAPSRRVPSATLSHLLGRSTLAAPHLQPVQHNAGKNDPDLETMLENNNSSPSDVHVLHWRKQEETTTTTPLNVTKTHPFSPTKVCHNHSFLSYKQTVFCRNVEQLKTA